MAWLGSPTAITGCPRPVAGESPENSLASIVAWATDFGLEWWQYLMAVNVLLMLLGMILEVFSVLLLTMPVLLPLLQPLGIDPVHFGVVVTMNMEIAGHEWWSQDGSTVWYDLQTPRGEDFWVAGYDVETGKRRWNHVDRNSWGVHFNSNADTTLFASDEAREAILEALELVDKLKGIGDDPRQERD